MPRFGQKTPREVLVLLRDRDVALAYEAFPLQQKGSIPAVVLAEEALAEFRRANNLAESNERLTGLKCCVGPPGLENDATTIIDTFFYYFVCLISTSFTNMFIYPFISCTFIMIIIIYKRA